MKPSVYMSPVARTVPAENTETGLQAENVQEFIDLGITVKNDTPVEFSVMAGFTRIYPNLGISDSLTVTIEENGEIVVL